MFGFICNLKTALEYKFSNPEATYDGRMGRVKDQSGNWNLELFSNFSTSFFLTLRNRLTLDRYESADGFTNKMDFEQNGFFGGVGHCLSLFCKEPVYLHAPPQYDA